MLKKRTPVLWVVLLVFVLACNFPTPSGKTATSTPMGGTPLPGGETPGGTLLPPTYTPLPPVTTAAGCILDADFVADVTVPDNTSLVPGTAFRKTWRIKNSGSCNWENGTLLAFIGGDSMGSVGGTVAVPAAAVGATLDVSVDFKAPSTAGTYRSTWQLVAPDGTHYGSDLYVQIVVPGTPTGVPSQTPTQPAGNMLTTTPTPTLLPGCSAVDPQLQSVLDQALAMGINPGCAKGAAFSTAGAVQEYWTNIASADASLHYKSVFIWRSDTRQIYAVRGSDLTTTEATLLAVYLDEWKEGQPNIPASCTGMVPPAGYIVPVRGFGRVWCLNHLWNAVGYPRQAEVAVSLLIQGMDHGVLIKATGPAPAPFAVAVDTSGGKATLRVLTP